MKTCANIYKSGREYAKLTQEQAAELLGVSQRRLSDYENEVTPPDDIVARMIEIYQYPQIAHSHLKSNPVGRKFLPDIPIESLEKTVLKLHKEIKHITDRCDVTIEIASDGVITMDELEIWEENKIHFSEMLAILWALVMIY